MIDSNNISVMRENLRTLANINSGLITNIEANTDAIGEINSLIGATPLPTGKTITSALNGTYETPTDLLSGVSVDAGGYGKIGNLVILDIRINSTDNIPNNTDVCTIPVSGIPTPYFIQVLDQNGKKWRVVGDKLRTGEGISSGVSILSLNYLSYTNS